MSDSANKPTKADSPTLFSEHYPQIIKAAGYVFLSINEDGRYSHVHGAVVEITGYEADQLVGQHFSTLIRPDWREHVINFYAADTGDGSILFPIITKNNEERWIEQRIIKTKNTAGTTFHAIVFDITERRQMEIELRANEHRLNAFFENATEALVVVNKNGQMVTFNKSAEKIFGYSREEIVNKPLALLIPERHRGKHLQHITHYLENPHPRQMGQSLELCALRKNGSEFPVEISLSYNHSTEETVAFVIDITLRVEYEQQLAKRIQQLTTLREIDAALAERLDINYVLKMALESALKLSGANAGFIGLIEEDGSVRLTDIQGDYSNYTPGQTVKHIDGVVARVMRTQQAELVVNVTADPDFVVHYPGTVSQLSIPLISQEQMIGILNLETSEDGKFNEDIFNLVKMVTARIATAVENARLHQQTQNQLTELQGLYEKVSQLEQLKTDMIRIASHDLRSPLSVILGNAELLRIEINENNNPECLHEFVDHIWESVNRMRKITSDILSLERIEETAQNMSFTSFDLAELVRDVFAENKTPILAESRRMTLSAPGDDAPVLVQGDAAQMREAVGNLICNAIKYTQPDGKITITLKQKADNAIFEVKDNGFGIRKEQQGKLFQPFYRARTAKTSDIEGTGLGLHLVKNIVERHNGTIHFKSELDKGSTFGFTLPRITE